MSVYYTTCHFQKGGLVISRSLYSTVLQNVLVSGPLEGTAEPIPGSSPGKQDQDHVLLTPATALPPVPVHLRSKCQDRVTPLEKQTLSLTMFMTSSPQPQGQHEHAPDFGSESLFLQGSPLNPERGAVWSHDEPVLTLHKLSI